MAVSKRARIILGVSALAALWLIVTAVDANVVLAGDNAASFRRGIAISHAMAWARIEPGPARAFAFPPFSDQSNTLRRDELRTLRRAGFDFVRLAVDPGPFLQFHGAHRDALDDILLDRVTLILAAGLSVVVDFHPSDLHPDYTARALTAGLDTPVFRDYLRMLERTAGLLDRLHSKKVALELMNEPPIRAGAWQPILEAAYAAVRHRSTDLPLVIEGGDEATAADLVAIRTALFANDGALLFSFHYYDPYQFTHQGAPWNAARHLTDVPYPALARPLADSLDATAAAIAATDLEQDTKSSAYRDAQGRLESYRRSAFDRNTIAQKFDDIANWARAQGLPSARLMLGEFGARRTALQLDGRRAAERARWFRDVREEAETHGFGWAVWTYRGSGDFGLAGSETSDELEPGVATALGLSRLAPVDAIPAAANQTSRVRP
ncbi:MAG TPA: cellulase family glycosylhydrolase [Xanthobacteraceae bacterium]|nr:cellulase family glycosylhydrolase [Xanthobacteraceae bacterium]